MSRRGVLTLTTGVCLWGVYLLYAQWVSPLFAPPALNPPVAGRATGPSRVGVWPPSSGLRENMEWAQRYLPSQPWAADANKQLSTPEAFVYTQEYELVEGRGSLGDDLPAEAFGGEGRSHEVRFRPFAMIWRQGPGGEPLTVVSDSALVRFAGEFDNANLNPGRPIAGRLEGDVRISGGDGLSVVGRNFFFSEGALRIWSESPLEFAFGPHTGHARGMQVELIPSEGPIRNDQPAVAGVRSIRLRRNVVMNLVWDAEPETGKPPVHVDIRSLGGFEYVLADRRATFEHDVRVHRPTEPGKYDSLLCDLLTLLFEPKEPEPAEGAASIAARADAKTGGARGAGGVAGDSQTSNKADKAGAFDGLGGDLTFRMLWAEGKVVELNSQTNDLSAWMSRLVYSKRTNVAVLSDEQRVRVVHGASELRCPEIKLMHDDRGQVTATWCQGAGWLRSRDPQSQDLAFFAKWDKQMRTYPDPDGPLHVIELEQQVVVRQPEREMGLTGEIVKLWVEQTEEPADSRRSSDSPPSAGPAGFGNPAIDQTGGLRTGGIRPRRMLALKNVGWVSPQIEGQTHRLEVWFEDSPPADASTHRRGAGATSREPAGTGPLTQRSGGRLVPTVHAAGATSDDRMPGPGRIDFERRSNQGPLVLTSDLIRIRVLQGAERDDLHVAEVWTQGGVHLTQEREPGTPPLVVTGRRLHLWNHGEAEQELHLSGSPAHIYDRGRMHIEGGDIHFDRAKNTAIVAGKGLLQISVGTTLEGEPLDEPQMLDVWWTERMVFDGRQAKFLGDVRAVLDQNRNRMHCHDMEVTLSEPVSFSDDRPDGKVDIEQVLCKHNVEFASFRFEDNKVVEIRQARFFTFSFNHATNDMLAQGPGWLQMWQRGRGKRASLSPSAVARANKPLQSDAADWEYTRIDFSGKAEGNLGQSYTTFHDNVRIVYGPVEGPSATIDPDFLSKDAGWMRCQTLEFAQQKRADGGGPSGRGSARGSSAAFDRRDGSIQLVGRGNVELEGETFRAQADTITYDESKGLFTLRSFGDGKARIWREQSTAPASGYKLTEAQGMLFIPSENRLKLSGTTYLEELRP